MNRSLFGLRQYLTDLPSRKASFFIILLPVVLMILSVVAPYISLPKKITEFLVFVGSPVIALLISCFAAFYLLGIKQGINKKMIKKLTDESLLPVGSIILIIGAGGGFKQILIESGVGTAIAQMAEHISLSPIVLAFMVAGLITNCNRFSYCSINDSSWNCFTGYSAHVWCKFRITRYCNRCRFINVFSRK